MANVVTAEVVPSTFADDHVRAAATQAAIDFARMMQAADVFPICGTLLGLIREGDLIAHDSDVDFGCLNWPAYQCDLGPFRIEAEFHNQGNLCERVYRHANGTKIDLFRMFRTGVDTISMHIYPDEFPQVPTVIRSYNSSLFASRIALPWKGFRFNCLADPAAWLAAHYGLNWQNPDPHFDYFKRD